jgi:hypothetical protein
MFLGCLPCCDGECGFDFSGVDSVTVTMQTAGDYVANSQIVDNQGRKYRLSGFSYIGMFNGTHVLTRTQHNVPLPAALLNRTGSIWSLDLGGEDGCTTGAIEYHVAHSIGPTGTAGRLHSVLYLRIGFMSIGGVQTFPGDTNPNYQNCTSAVDYYTDPTLGCEQSNVGLCFSRTFGTLYRPGSVLQNNAFAAIRIECESQNLVARNSSTGIEADGVVGSLSARTNGGAEIGVGLVLSCTFETGCDDDQAELFQINAPNQINLESIAITSPDREWTFT